MSTAFVNVAGVIDAPLRGADDGEFPFGSNVLSLQSRRDRRRSVSGQPSRALENDKNSRKPFWSGIDGLLVTGALAKALNLPQAAGLLVHRIGDGSIGSRLGTNPGTLRVTIQGTDILLGGDVILRVNNISVIDPRSAQSVGNLTTDEKYERIYNSVATLKPGDPLVVTVFREGKVLRLTTMIDR